MGISLLKVGISLLKVGISLLKVGISLLKVGIAARAMSYKIQKWNVKSSRTFPFLLANTRVDWLGLDDSQTTQRFQVLREGILRDVFSQRASSAWQGAPAQKVTVNRCKATNPNAEHNPGQRIDRRI